MPSDVSINRALWSRSSQRSAGGHYDASATHYEGIRYRCRACEVNCIFSAQEQRVAYEVNKKYVWWLPALCATCSERLIALRATDKLHQAQWNQQRQSLAADRTFLESWLAVIQGLRAHGKPNDSMERMLVRRLLELPMSPRQEGAA